MTKSADFSCQEPISFFGLKIFFIFSYIIDQEILLNPPHHFETVYTILSFQDHSVVLNKKR